MLFLRNDIPAKVVSTYDRPIKSFYVELYFRKKKWLWNCSCNPKHGSVESYLDSLFKSIDSLPSKFENFILLGDFNSCMEDSPMKTFGGIYKLRNLIKEPICFKKPENPISYCQTNRLASKIHMR